MEFRNIFIVIASCVVLTLAESPLDQISSSNQNGAYLNSYRVPSSGQYDVPGRGNGGGRDNGQFGGFSSRRQDATANQFGQTSGQDESNLNREPANYDFNYNVQDDQFGVQFQHRENRQGDGTRGSYKVLLPDGRIQHVEYEADENGFRPRIRYEDAPSGFNPGGIPSRAVAGSGKENRSAGYQFKK